MGKGAEPKGATPPGAGGGRDFRFLTPDKALAALARRGGPWALAHYGVYMLIVAVLVLIDPFGLGGALDRVSERIAYRIVLGPTYPGSVTQDTKACPVLHRKPRVAVVLLREQDLGILGETWPISLARHAQVLERIRRFRPLGVLVDFAFIDKRDDAFGITRLKRVVQRYACSGKGGDGECTPVPLYFARATGHGVPPIRADLEPLLGKRLVDVPIMLGNGGVRTYPPYFKNDGVYDRTRPTAAFRLYWDVKGCAGNIGDAFETDLDIVWSNKVDPMNRKWMIGCAPDIPVTTRIMRMLLEGDVDDQGCPYTATVPLAALLRNPGDDDIASILEGAVVIYGAGFAVGSDVVTTAVHPKLPGLYVHAMALDNLFSFGMDYKKSEYVAPNTLPYIFKKSLQIFVGTKNRIEFWFSLILSIITVRAVRWRVNRAYLLDGADADLGHMGFGFFMILEAIYLLGAIIVSTGAYVVLGISPANWLGLFGLATTVAAIASRRWVEWALANGLAIAGGLPAHNGTRGKGGGE